ncbi:methyl esterase 3 [Rhynchospora pubera]|uniref:Methyl esterase 3 n=1 Tax=Rhynchospora pubera TaxID=906938 RepID=A0AAV8FBZ3_9POAL|nr:methyl esterase 3 [Rhynchospora pubera]
MEGRKKHFLLVHGACHGAWCWYKVASLLKSAGNNVTALDLAACGVHPKRITELESFAEYSEPLLQALQSVPENERVILVGHSFGGLSLALAMERFPEKISVAVFASAALPRVGFPLSIVLEEFYKIIGPDHDMDNTYSSSENSYDPREILHMGTEYLSKRLYQLCTQEDITLSKMLVRPVNIFLWDEAMTKQTNLTEEKYGSVRREYIVCGADNSWSAEFQRSMVEKSLGTEMREIDDADHMLMLSKPKELVHHLVDIATKYA